MVKFSPYHLVLHSDDSGGQDVYQKLKKILDDDKFFIARHQYPLLEGLSSCDACEGGVTLDMNHLSDVSTISRALYGEGPPYTDIRDLRFGITADASGPTLTQHHGPHCTRDELIALKKYIEINTDIKVTAHPFHFAINTLGPDAFDMEPIP